MAVPTPEFSPDELNELLSAVMPEIPGHRVMRRIGRGGMSFVYLGVQESLERQVAIKVIAPTALKDEVSKLRFEKEARTIAKLQHPCIVSIYAVGRTEQGLLYYVLPYLSKGHLGQRDLQGNDSRIAEVVRALLWALDYAHERGVVHRDVKAENVLFDNADRPLLTDFGIAFSRHDRSRMTGSGFAVGSGAHMAPEQARGEQVDGRADLYSLGVLTFEMLSGYLPFQNSDPLGLALMHAVDPVPRLPPGAAHWQPFIDKAMAKSPDHRFANAREMMAALDALRAKRERRLAIRGTPWMAWKRRCLRLIRRFRIARWRALGKGILSSVQTRRKPVLLGLATLAVLLFAFLLWPTAQRTATQPVVSPEPLPPPTSTASIDMKPRGKHDDDALAETETAAPIDIDAIEITAAAPMLPGALELAAATEQISRRRLTQPPGDNAFESLRSAQRIIPQSPRLRVLGERWLQTALPYLNEALSSGNQASMQNLYGSASTLANELQLRESDSWVALEQAVTSPLLLNLQQALLDKDVSRLQAVKTRIRSLGLEPDRFEPYWSQKIVLARVGDPLRPESPLTVLVRLPEGDSAGLAIMSHAVTRDEYAAFAKASRRPSANCRIRTALMTLRKRTWDKPGFAQTGNHPVVCVSLADAKAYAQWLGQKLGHGFRLPTTAEWRQFADFTAVGNACRSGQIRCQSGGTTAADSGPPSAPGVRAMHGNIREWQADCSGDCRQHLTLGFSWRDSPERASANKDETVDVAVGYDDIGFRLLREVQRSELEAR